MPDRVTISLGWSECKSLERLLITFFGAVCAGIGRALHALSLPSLCGLCHPSNGLPSAQARHFDRPALRLSLSGVRNGERSHRPRAAFAALSLPFRDGL